MTKARSVNHTTNPWSATVHWRQVGIMLLICAVAAALVIGLIGSSNGSLRKWELSLGDFLTGDRGGGMIDDRLVLVGIDDESLNVLDVLDEEIVTANPHLDSMSFGYPFPRSVYAGLGEKLLDAGARLIVFDMLFDLEREGDAEFKAFIEANPGKVVVGCNFVAHEVAETNTTASKAKFVLPSASVLVTEGGLDPRVGFVNFFPDADSTVRSANLKMRAYPHEAAPVRHSLAMAALTQLGEKGRGAQSIGDYYVRFPHLIRDDSEYAPLPFYTLFVDYDWEKSYAGGESFRDKIVYVGGTSDVAFHDVVSIPEGDVLGVQLQMSTLASLLAGDFYAVSGRLGEVLSVLLMAAIVFGIAFIMRRPIVGLLVLIATGVLYLLAVRSCYSSLDFLLPSAAPMLTLALAGISCFGSRFAMEQVEKARLRRTLERQMSKELAEHVLGRREDYFESLPGERKPVTVLFSDIRSFTSRSEKDDPVALVSQLKEYLDEMGKIVFEHGGVVDKFIGDAVMAVWGNIRSDGAEADSRNAVAAAIAMQVRLTELNAKWGAAGREGFEIGIGLNHGDAIFGMMGSEQKQEMTVIGDPVNQAARLEGLTKKFGLGIIVGPRVAELVRDDFALRSLGKVRTMGKEEGEELAAVLTDAGDSAQADWLRRYQEALEAFQRGEMEAAKVGFMKCSNEQPGDLAVPMFLQAIESGESFGELVMTGK